MRAGTLWHRSTYIAVKRTSGALVVHRRADWKDVYAGLWDIAFGGVCDVGEDWAEAAARELGEEAGLVNQDLQFAGRGTYDQPDGRVVGMAYTVVTDDPLQCNDGEVVELAEVAPADLTQWLEAHPVCADSLQIMLPLL